MGNDLDFLKGRLVNPLRVFTRIMEKVFTVCIGNIDWNNHYILRNGVFQNQQTNQQIALFIYNSISGKFPSIDERLEMEEPEKSKCNDS